MTGRRALLVVDVQRGFEDPALGPRDNPHAEENVAKLIGPMTGINLQGEFAEVVTTAAACT